MIPISSMKTDLNTSDSEAQTNSGCTTAGCAHCGKSKSPYQCGICNDALCKSCVQFMPDGAFQYLTNRPPEISHNWYCSVCFDNNVGTALATYEEIADRARKISVFDISQGKETRFIKRIEKPVVMESGLDQFDITMRLAYIAAEKNCNALVDVNIKAVKVRDGSYQTTAYSGSGIPTIVDDRKLMKDRSLWTDPN